MLAKKRQILSQHQFMLTVKRDIGLLNKANVSQGIGYLPLLRSYCRQTVKMDQTYDLIQYSDDIYLQ